MNNYTDKVIKEFREKFYRVVEVYPDGSRIVQYDDDLEDFLTEKLTALEDMYEKAISIDILSKDEKFKTVNGVFWMERLRDEIRQAVKEAKGEV